MKQLICTKIFIFSDPVESTDTDVQQGRSALDDEAATEETELITAAESRESVTTGTERDDKAEDRVFIDVLSLVTGTFTDLKNLKKQIFTSLDCTILTLIIVIVLPLSSSPG